MFTNWDTVIAAVGLLIFLAGIYLWLGLAAALILLGIILIYIGMKITIIPAKAKDNGANQTTNT